jgi:hypothetical protein
LHNPDALPISLAQSTTFQKDLADATKSSSPRDAVTKVARAFITDKSFIGTPDGKPFQVKLVHFGTSLDNLGKGGTLLLSAVLGAVKNAFGQKVGDVVKQPEFLTVLEGLRDSVLAIKYVQVSHCLPLNFLF